MRISLQPDAVTTHVLEEMAADLDLPIDILVRHTIYLAIMDLYHSATPLERKAIGKRRRDLERRFPCLITRAHAQLRLSELPF